MHTDPLSGAEENLQPLISSDALSEDLRAPTNAALPNSPLPNEIRIQLEELRKNLEIIEWDPTRSFAAPHADEIAKLFYKIYGNGYVEPEFVDPSLLVEKVDSGRWIPALIFEGVEKETLLAHAALVPLGDGMIEVGRIVVNPLAQGMGLGKLVTALAMNQLPLLSATSNTDVFFSECVTQHPKSQAIFRDLGFVPSALYLSKYTDFFGNGSRESVVYLASILEPKVREERHVYLHPAFSEVSKEIYANLQCARVLTAHNTAESCNTNFSEVGLIKVMDSDLDAFQVITIKTEGAIDSTDLEQAIETSLQRGTRSLVIKLDLSVEESITLAENLRAKGMIFAGIEVHPERDYLCMQLVPGFQSGAFDHLALHCAESKRLLEFMTREFEGR